MAIDPPEPQTQPVAPPPRQLTMADFAPHERNPQEIRRLLAGMFDGTYQPVLKIERSWVPSALRGFMPLWAIVFVIIALHILGWWEAANWTFGDRYLLELLLWGINTISIFIVLLGFPIAIAESLLRFGNDYEVIVTSKTLPFFRAITRLSPWHRRYTVEIGSLFCGYQFLLHVGRKEFQVPRRIFMHRRVLGLQQTLWLGGRIISADEAKKFAPDNITYGFRYGRRTLTQFVVSTTAADDTKNTTSSSEGIVETLLDLGNVALLTAQRGEFGSGSDYVGGIVNYSLAMAIISELRNMASDGLLKHADPAAGAARQPVGRRP